MSYGPVSKKTKNAGFNLVRPDFPRWAEFEHQNWEAADALFASMGAVSTKGVWENDTIYAVGDRAIDVDTNSVWANQVQHTSPSTGTFEDYRSSNPTHWKALSSSLNFRGNWAASIVYFVGDIVNVNNKYYQCITTHTAGVSFTGEEWAMIFDASPAITARNEAQTAAATATSAKNAAATSASNAAASESAASTSRSDAQSAATTAINMRGEVLIARNATLNYRDAALQYRNEAQVYKELAEAASAAASTFDSNQYYTKTAADARYPKLASASNFTTRPTVNSSPVWDGNNLPAGAAGKSVLSKETVAEIQALLSKGGYRIATFFAAADGTDTVTSSTSNLAAGTGYQTVNHGVTNLSAYVLFFGSVDCRAEVNTQGASDAGIVLQAEVSNGSVGTLVGSAAYNIFTQSGTTDYLDRKSVPIFGYTTGTNAVGVSATGVIYYRVRFSAVYTNNLARVLGWYILGMVVVPD